MEYTIIIVNKANIVGFYPHYNFKTADECHRFCEGISFGMFATKHNRWAVVALLNGEYDTITTITKNLTYKHTEVLFRELQIKVTKSVPL